jgi:putative membrane protein
MEKQKFCRRAMAMTSAALLCSALAVAQRPGGGAPGTSPNQTQNPSAPDQMNNMQQQAPGQPTPMDREFVKKAMEGGLAEVQLGQLALQKSSNDQVKQFAQRMVDDHTKMGDQMKPIAQQLGVNAPTEPSKKDKATMAKLQALSGSAFDQAYIRDMVKDHKADLKEFQSEASSGSDPNVKNAATQGSQIISQHLQMAQQMAKDQNVNLSAKGQ